MSCKYNNKIFCNQAEDRISCNECPCQLAVDGYLDKLQEKLESRLNELDHEEESE